MIQFNKKVLFVGYGAVAQCALPILFQHLKVPAKNVTVMDFENRREMLRPWITRGVKFTQQRVTRDNMGTLTPLLLPVLAPSAKAISYQFGSYQFSSA